MAMKSFLTSAKACHTMKDGPAPVPPGADYRGYFG